MKGLFTLRMNNYNIDLHDPCKCMPPTCNYIHISNGKGLHFKTSLFQAVFEALNIANMNINISHSH